MPHSSLFFLLPHSPDPQLCIACASEAQELPGSSRAVLGTPPQTWLQEDTEGSRSRSSTACAGVGAALAPAAFGDTGLQMRWVVGTSSPPPPRCHRARGGASEGQHFIHAPSAHLINLPKSPPEPGLISG